MWYIHASSIELNYIRMWDTGQLSYFNSKRFTFWFCFDALDSYIDTTPTTFPNNSKCTFSYNLNSIFMFVFIFLLYCTQIYLSEFNFIVVNFFHKLKAILKWIIFVTRHRVIQRTCINLQIHTSQKIHLFEINFKLSKYFQ